MKNKWKATTAVGISLMALALVLFVPPGTIKVSMVISDPDFDETTKIYEVNVDNSTVFGYSFNENNQTVNVNVGYTVSRLQVHVFINKGYASTEELAHSYTRVYITVKNPATSTVYENWLDNTTIIADYGTYWKLVKRDDNFTPFELTEGTWTITTKYDVYA